MGIAETNFDAGVSLGADDDIKFYMDLAAPFTLKYMGHSILRFRGICAGKGVFSLC
jgi:hypothetical protein